MNNKIKNGRENAKVLQRCINGLYETQYVNSDNTDSYPIFMDVLKLIAKHGFIINPELIKTGKKKGEIRRFVIEYDVAKTIENNTVPSTMSVDDDNQIRLNIEEDKSIITLNDLLSQRKSTYCKGKYMIDKDFRLGLIFLYAFNNPKNKLRFSFYYVKENGEISTSSKNEDKCQIIGDKKDVIETYSELTSLNIHHENIYNMLYYLDKLEEYKNK